MDRASLYDKIVLTYRVTDELSVRLVEICNWRPDFPRCRYCGANEFWNIAWPTALALSRYLASAFPLARMKGRRVLVVGCGVGLESVVLAKLGARVWALDHVPEALRLVKQNCELNAIAPVHTICCCWQDAKRARRIGHYDMLIGSDVLYEPEDGEWIKSLLTATVKPEGVALFADPLREGVEEFFQGLAASGFRVQAHRAWTRWLSSNEKVRIYQVERLPANRTQT
jgi:2-polyprenyl-3-methyl-5-hydroxy-6-metoxy-1,4-benzoquinol methylase